MISGMIKVVVSAFEIYVADVISRQHIGDKNYWQDKGEYTFNFIRLAMACNETIFFQFVSPWHTFQCTVHLGSSWYL